MHTQSLLHQVLQMPHIYLFMRELEDALAKEQEARAKYYELMDAHKRVEFINGEITAPALHSEKHNVVSQQLGRLITKYLQRHQVGKLFVEDAHVFLTRNTYIPDICFFSNEKTKYFTPTQNKFPAPDLVVEVITRFSERIDKMIKFADYEAHQIPEYWIIDPERGFVEQYRYERTEYEMIMKTNHGKIKSFVLPDFEISIESIFDSELNHKMLEKL